MYGDIERAESIPSIEQLQDLKTNLDIHSRLENTSEHQEPMQKVEVVEENQVKKPVQKLRVRQAHKVDGVFETGLDVVEHEIDVGTANTVAQIQLLYQEGKLTQ